MSKIQFIKILKILKSLIHLLVCSTGCILPTLFEKTSVGLGLTGRGTGGILSYISLFILEPTSLRWYLKSGFKTDTVH